MSTVTFCKKSSDINFSVYEFGYGFVVELFECGCLVWLWMSMNPFAES
jgi:hypothetical protein